MVQAGEQVALSGGSGSKVLMAHMPTATLTPIVNSIARSTKRSPSDILAELARIREKGYAVSDGERLLGVMAVSAPIYDSNNDVGYCLTVAGPSVRMHAKEKETVKLVVDAAGEISLQFGGRTPGRN